MCHPKRCRTCAKTTWAGCGGHVAAVKASVPPDQWCNGHRDEPSGRFSLLQRITGRGK